MRIVGLDEKDPVLSFWQRAFVVTLAALPRLLATLMLHAIPLPLLGALRSPPFASSKVRMMPTMTTLAKGLLITAFLLGVVGLYFGLWRAPASAQQGVLYRILLVHVPASWMSLFLYPALAAWAIFTGVRGHFFPWRTIQAVAPTGALMTLLSLATGMLWGIPAWGSAWAWDARLTTELILLLFYISLMTLASTADSSPIRNGAGWIFLLLGTVLVPVIYFSVLWWPGLHQSASLGWGRPALMHPCMLNALLLMCLGFFAYSLAAILLRWQCLATKAYFQKC